MKKATAVDWLVEQMFGEHTRAWQKQINQAKAIEKKQIIDAYIEGYSSNLNAGDSEQYYNETYNTDTP